MSLFLLNRRSRAARGAAGFHPQLRTWEGDSGDIIASSWWS